MKRLIKTLLLAIITVSILVSCGQKSTEVAYTIYPIEYLLERIGGNLVETKSISDGKVAIRSKLNDDYLSVIKSSDAIFTIGNLEPYLDTISKDIEDYRPNIIDLGSRGALVPFERYTLAIIDNVEVEVTSRYYDNPIFDNVDTYNHDPYIWLDPIMMTSMANEIKNYFISINPQNQSYYEANFELVKMDLAFLDANYSELKKLKGLSIATMIPAFGRYANNYGIKVSPIILSKYGRLPSDAQLEIIKARLLNDGVQYLIIEDDLDQDILDMAQAVSDELDIELVTLYSLSSRSAEQIKNGEDYLHIMNENLATLLKLENIQE